MDHKLFLTNLKLKSDPGLVKHSKFVEKLKYSIKFMMSHRPNHKMSLERA